MLWMYLLGCSGSGSVTLDVPGLDGFGGVASALWFDTPEPGEYWIIDTESGSAENLGDVMVSSLGITTAADSCAEVQNDYADATEHVLPAVRKLREGGTMADACAELTDYFAWVEADSASWGTANRNTLNADADGLQGLTTDGTFEGGWGSFILRTEWGEAWRAWDADACAFDFDTDWEGESTVGFVDDVVFELQAAQSTVEGTLTGGVELETGETGTIDAHFSAVRCEIEPFTLLGFY
jgi:hypothetical protein